MKNIPDNPQNSTPSFSHLKKQVQDKAISESNFTEFVVARMEGELSPAGEEALNRFLSDHPGYAGEARLLSLCVAPVDSAVSFPDKESLYQTVHFRPEESDTEYFEEQLVAFLEGDLPPEEHDKMKEHLLLNPEMNLRIAQYRRAYLTPDPKVVFPGKDALKQDAPMIPFQRRVWLTGISIAASVALLIGIYLQMPDNMGKREYFPGSPLASLMQMDPTPDDPSRLNIHRLEAAGKATHQRSSSLRELSPDKHIATESLSVAMIRPTEPLPGKFSPRPLPGSIGSPGMPVPGPDASRLLASSLPAGSSLTHPGLTVVSFPVEQIRYYTGGGNQKPGLLADLSLSQIADATHAHEFINNTGQNLYQRWEAWKESTLDAVLPFR
ncbi:MAG TPA: hypothetical protein P5228_00635 [Bacteroidales bacterium]|nr:hypothetical protein [Bacteroidales bacterium]HRZ48031.1 hypothetical protein [Bacteroidales bacterium]